MKFLIVFAALCTFPLYAVEKCGDIYQEGELTVHHYKLESNRFTIFVNHNNDTSKESLLELLTLLGENRIQIFPKVLTNQGGYLELEIKIFIELHDRFTKEDRDRLLSQIAALPGIYVECSRKPPGDARSPGAGFGN